MNYITLNSVCQELFSSFFELFRGDSPCCCFRGNSVILAWMLPFVKNFFPFSPKFLHPCSIPPPSRTACCILSYVVLFVKRYFSEFDTFFVRSHSKKRSLLRGPFPALFLIRYHRSGRNRRRCAYRQPRRFRRYPHPGRRRNCGPADSSASPLPHESLA